MQRRQVKQNKDKRVFKQTASKTPAINHPRLIMRGGIRL